MFARFILTSTICAALTVRSTDEEVSMVVDGGGMVRAATGAVQDTAWWQCIEATLGGGASAACAAPDGQVLGALVGGLHRTGHLAVGCAPALDGVAPGTAALYAACAAKTEADCGDGNGGSDETGCVRREPSPLFVVDGNAVTFYLGRTVYGEIASRSRVPFYWQVDPVLTLTASSASVVEVAGLSKRATPEAAQYYQVAVAAHGECGRCTADQRQLFRAVSDPDDPLVEVPNAEFDCLVAERKCAGEYLLGNSPLQGAGKISAVMADSAPNGKVMSSKDNAAKMFYGFLTATSDRITALEFDKSGVIAHSAAILESATEEDLLAQRAEKAAELEAYTGGAEPAESEKQRFEAELARLETQLEEERAAQREFNGKGVLFAAREIAGLAGWGGMINKKALSTGMKSTYALMQFMSGGGGPLMQAASAKAKLGFASADKMAALFSACEIDPEAYADGKTQRAVADWQSTEFGVAALEQRAAGQTFNPPCAGSGPSDGSWFSAAARLSWAVSPGPGLLA